MRSALLREGGDAWCGDLGAWRAWLCLSVLGIPVSEGGALVDTYKPAAKVLNPPQQVLLQGRGADSFPLLSCVSQGPRDRASAMSLLLIKG